MDMERGPEEVALRALGFAGICREILRVARSRSPGFAILAGEVTVLTMSLLVHIATSRSVFSDALDSSDTGAGLLRLATNWAPFFLLEVAYLVVIVVQWLRATIFCVFSVAPRYGVTDDRDTRDLRTIPRFRGDSRSAARLVGTGRKVAGGLAATCLRAFLLLLGYTSLTGASAWLAHGHLLNAAPGEKSGVQLARVALLLLGGVVYFAGARHIGLVWRVASVMMLLEEAWSFRALHMSEDLLHLARMSWAPAAVLTLDGCILAAQLAFGALVVVGRRRDGPRRLAPSGRGAGDGGGAVGGGDGRDGGAGGAVLCVQELPPRERALTARRRRTSPTSAGEEKALGSAQQRCNATA